LPRTTPHLRSSQDQKSPQLHLVSLAVESLSTRRTCPIGDELDGAVALPQMSPSSGSLIGARGQSLLRLTRKVPTPLTAIPLTVVATRAYDNRGIAHPTGKPSPSLCRTLAHREPETRIRFLDNSPGICETPTWRCRVIRAIAKEGTVARPSLPIYFGGTKPNGTWLHPPDSLLPGAGCLARNSGFDLANSHLQTDPRSQRQDESRRVATPLC
jgi:hypothetical protein